MAFFGILFLTALYMLGLLHGFAAYARFIQAKYASSILNGGLMVFYHLVILWSCLQVISV